MVNPQVPTLIIILLYIFARMSFFLCGKKFNRWRDIRKAAALGAEIPPYIPQSNLKTMNELKMMVEKGYPGKRAQAW